MFTSVIMPAYNQTKLSAHITMAALANIRKFTDTEDYELIVVEDIPKEPIRDEYKALSLDKHIILHEYTNYSTKMNIGAKNARGEYLAFIQNDVFVWEGWLPALRWYLENGKGDFVIPDQLPRTREFVKKSYEMTMEEGMNQGVRDACMIMMTRKGYDTIGGFNDDLKIFVEADVYDRIAKAGLNLVTTNKTLITHITLATHYQDMEAMEALMHHDSLLRNVV